MTGEGDAVWFEHLTMDDVVDGIADEDAGGKVGTEQLVAIGGGTVARGDVMELARIVETLTSAAGGIQAGGVGIVREHLFGGTHREMAIARQVMFGEKIVPQPGGIIIAKPMTPIVAVPTILGLPLDGFEFAAVGTKPEVASAHVDGRRGILAGRSGSG